jgi:hypothetical protein
MMRKLLTALMLLLLVGLLAAYDMDDDANSEEGVSGDLPAYPVGAGGYC